MSSTIDACSCSEKREFKCLNSEDGKHHYKVTCGTWPSCEMTCKYCGDRYYTK